MIVVWLFLAVPWVCLQFVIVVFPHLLFLVINRFRLTPVTGQSQPVMRNVRQEVVLARLRIGHTRITHTYLLNEKHNCIALGVCTFYSPSYYT